MSTTDTPTPTDSEIAPEAGSEIASETASETASDPGTETVQEPAEAGTEPETETESAPVTAEEAPAETAASEPAEAAEAAPTSHAHAGARGGAASSPAGSGAAPARPAKPVCQTTGRRKRAVARVRFRPGNGKITINRREFEAYFTSATHRMIVSEPLRISSIADRYDIDATIDGGGVSGQAGALRLGITRALIVIDPELRTNLKRAGLLTRDAREKESKKYGLKKARKAPQYSKR
jgi:small subunit ribosomal protein S9